MSHVFIIAEAGVNHNGDIKLAREMIDVAAKTGVDAIKFQTFKAENLVRADAIKAEYQKKSTDEAESQLDMLRKLELSFEDFQNLKNYCSEKKIVFLSSPFDIESAQFLRSIKMDIFKLPSGEITNVPLLRYVGSLNKKVIISTGMASLGEIEFALHNILDAGTEKANVSILHCNTEYPTPFADVNLKAMCTIKEAFRVDVGYSDHTDGIEVPIAAVALGAKIIEKHFTLNRQMPGPDHLASLEPDEIKRMVESIRNIEAALGDGRKIPSRSETKNKLIVRKSITAARLISKGERLTSENLTTKRPADGISPIFWDQLLERKARRAINPNERIQWQDLE